MALQKTIEESNYFCKSLSGSLSTLPTTGTTRYISPQDIFEVAKATVYDFNGYIPSPYLFSKFLLGKVRSNHSGAAQFGKFYGAKSSDLADLLTDFMFKLEIADSMGTLETILNESLDQSLSEVKEHKQSFLRGWR
jgi:hypothetical protein